MKFGPAPLGQTLGAVLAHAIRQGDLVLKKGTVISEADIRRLRNAGVEEIIVARFEPGDVNEDDAARALAEAIAAHDVRVEKPATGRSNLFSERCGVLLIDVAKIDAANAVDDAITVATLPAFRRVGIGEMIGTVKIIPFAVPRSKLDAAIESARGAIRIAPFRDKRIAVISTELPGLKRSVIDKTVRVLEDRLRRAGAAGAKIVSHGIVRHAAEPLQDALAEARADIIIVFGASAITDARDVIPSAIIAASGRIEHFGMPVDPGNLLLIGELHGAKVIGAPGCARSPAENGFDWVLERFLADVPVTKADIRKMGVGGLLMEIISRPQPRAPEAVPSAPQVAVIVLAAGSSTRMGGNKLVELWNGKPILRHSVEAALSSKRGGPFFMVTGHQPDRAEAAIEGLDVSALRNPDFASGMASSLKTGLAAVPASASAAVIMLGDMPKVTGALLDRLILAFGAHAEAKAVVPTIAGQRGNPVLLSRAAFAEVEKLSGDQGARKLFDAWGEAVIEVPLDDDALLFDVDTPEALAALRG